MPDTADAYVAVVQKQMNRLSDELMDGQDLEVIVPLANGSSIVASWFGFQNPDIITINGQDAEGHDACLLVHKSKLQVLLRKVDLPRGQPSSISFQQPAFDEPAPIEETLTDSELSEESPLDETA